MTAKKRKESITNAARDFLASSNKSARYHRVSNQVIQDLVESVNKRSYDFALEQAQQQDSYDFGWGTFYREVRDEDLPELDLTIDEANRCALKGNIGEYLRFWELYIRLELSKIK